MLQSFRLAIHGRADFVDLFLNKLLKRLYDDIKTWYNFHAMVLIFELNMKKERRYMSVVYTNFLIDCIERDLNKNSFFQCTTQLSAV